MGGAGRPHPAITFGHSLSQGTACVSVGAGISFKRLPCCRGRTRFRNHRSPVMIPLPQRVPPSVLPEHRMRQRILLSWCHLEPCLGDLVHEGRLRTHAERQIHKRTNSQASLTNHNLHFLGRSCGLWVFTFSKNEEAPKDVTTLRAGGGDGAGARLTVRSCRSLTRQHCLQQLSNVAVLLIFHKPTEGRAQKSLGESCRGANICAAIKSRRKLLCSEVSHRPPCA